MGDMALIVFFRGINVGGHRAFRPSVLAQELAIYDAVNVGAAGTLVVRKPGVRAKFLAELRRKLPFEATIACCDGRDLIRLEMDDPFGAEPPLADVVQFVSILSEAGRRGVSLPIALPEGGEWMVRIIGSKNRLVYGVYRRHMKTIGYLGQIDRLFGAPATTRSWKHHTVNRTDSEIPRVRQVGRREEREESLRKKVCGKEKLVDRPRKAMVCPTTVES